MRHTVTIYPADFLNNEYTGNSNCPLATALKRQYPEAEDIYVGVSYFTMKHPKLGFISRDFSSLELETIHHISDIEDLILFMSSHTDNPEKLTFNFITA